MVPNITGNLANYAIQGTGATGCFSAYGTVSSSAYDSSNHSRQASNVSMDASRVSGVYNSGTTTVRPCGIGTKFCIKYI